jgi:hypothetical protein
MKLIFSPLQTSSSYYLKIITLVIFFFQINSKTKFTTFIIYTLFDSLLASKYKNRNNLLLKTNPTLFFA